MPGTPKTSVVGARMAVEELRRQGADADKALGEAGLEMRTLNRDGAWIPFLKHAALLDVAVQETGDNFFGLHVAARLDPRDLGAIGYIGLSSQTLGDALLNLERYLATFTEALAIHLSTHDDLAVVWIEPTNPSFLRHRQALELANGALVKAYQFFTKTEIVPVEVRFVHAYAGGAQEHRQIIGCPVTFGHKRNEVVLRRKDLSAPIGTADDRLLRILITHCEDVLRQRASSKAENIGKLERCIIDLLPTGRAKAKHVATELGMSERSLVRHLSEMGTSFTDILSQLRHELALKYLREPKLNLTQVAFLLGYSNQSAFSAAFKRRTGRPPREMRGR